MQEQELERRKDALRDVQNAGEELVQAATAMQDVRATEMHLRTTTEKVTEALQLQRTYKALIQQLTLDNARASAKLEEVSSGLSKRKRDLDMLRMQQLKKKTDRQQAVAELKELQDEAAHQRQQHAQKLAYGQSVLKMAATRAKQAVQEAMGGDGCAKSRGSKCTTGENSDLWQRIVEHTSVRSLQDLTALPHAQDEMQRILEQLQASGKAEQARVQACCFFSNGRHMFGIQPWMSCLRIITVTPVMV